MQVVSLKLVSGEELVVRLLKETADSFTVDSPQVLQFQQQGNGQLGLAFVPWTISNPDAANIEIPLSMVMAKFTPSPIVEKQYLTQTSRILMG